MTKKILITGASGGFGKLTVLTLMQNGHQVAASMRDIDGKNKTVAAELRNAGAKVVELDVTNDASVKNGVKTSITELNGLDVLINNAGVGVLGMQEFFTTGDFQKVFDINVFGVQRMNREVIPYFRKKQDGIIVYTSSLLGRIALPFYGPYQASKWALEALAENYRVELSGFGIENCIIEPGGYPTAFSENLLKPSGIFAREDKDENGRNRTNPLYLKKHEIKPGHHALTIKVKGEPVKAGIDPYNKLIDRIPNDNMVEITIL